MLEINEFDSKIAKRLHELRIYRHFTQDEIAAHLNISPKTYKFYEQGRRKPSLEILLLLCEFYRITPNELLGYDEMARVAVICDKYDIHYKTIDDENVIITNRGTEYKIPKAIFAEIVFRSERMINHVVIQSRYLQELREYETSLIKGFIDYEIYFSDKCEYTLEEMDKDLEKIETDKNETIIEIDGKKMQIVADVSTAGYKNNLQDIIATVKRCRDSARDTI